MAKTEKRRIGDLGEDVACKYLENKGYVVLERNYWKPWGEIDIVAEKGSVLSFVEVKTVQGVGDSPVSREASAGVTREPISRGTVRPEENMHPRKVQRLHRAIQTYLLDRRVREDKQWQIDLVCVYLDFSTHKAKVELLENVIL